MAKRKPKRVFASGPLSDGLRAAIARWQADGNSLYALAKAADVHLPTLTQWYNGRTDRPASSITLAVADKLSGPLGLKLPVD